LKQDADEYGSNDDRDKDDVPVLGVFNADRNFAELKLKIIT
jgi:hypothetical protein